MHSTTVFALLAFVLRSTSQTIDPESVDYNTRLGWCNSQTAQCPILCSQIQNGSQAYSENSCDADTLIYSCICANGKTPPLAEYSLTIPYYECTTALSQCENACNADTTCQQQCRVTNKCGAQNPKRYNLTTTTSSSAAGQATGVAGGNQLLNGDGSDGGGSGATKGMAVFGGFWMTGGMLVVVGGVMAYL